LYRQGDVLLIPITNPIDGKGARTLDVGRRIVLAHGEATGHAHVVVGRDLALHAIGGFDYLTVPSPAELRHEEHGRILLPPGRYRVVRQREYDAVVGNVIVRD
jgi:hypothetical protein